MDAQSVINWAVIGQLIVNNTFELQHPTAVVTVYHSNGQALSTARFLRACESATADTCGASCAQKRYDVLG